MNDDYVTDDARGENWHMMLGDSCERLAELGTDSIDLSVYSPPFASLFTYSPSLRDLGNSSTRDDFLDHYAYILAEVLRVTKPRSAVMRSRPAVDDVESDARSDGSDGLPRRGHPRSPESRMDVPR